MATSANTAYIPSEIEELNKALDQYRNASSELRTESEKLLSVYTNYFNYSEKELNKIIANSPQLKQIFEELKQIATEYRDILKQSSDNVEELSNKLGVNAKIAEHIADVQDKNPSVFKELLDLQETLNNTGSLSIDQAERKLQLCQFLGVNEKELNAVLYDRVDNESKINDFNQKRVILEQKEAELENKRVEKARELTNEAKAQVDLENKRNEAIARGNAYLQVAFGILKQGSDKWREIDQMTTDYGRHISINAQEIKGFRENALSTFGDIAAKFGMSSKEIQEFQDKYIESTGRAIQLTKEQTETMVAVSSFAGPQATLEMVQNMDDFGGSTEAAMGYMAKGFQNATAQGLNARKFSEAYANNLKLASQYNFREGVSGIERMTMLSQRLKVNMQSIATAADKFQDVDSAIQTSARLQVLGGTYASSFSNPLEMMSMAQTDMEGFTNKILEGFQGKAYWNEKTGTMDMSALDKRMLREAAAALGIDYQEAYKMATQQGKLNEIDKYIDSSMSEENKTFLENKAQYNTEKQQWEITYQDKDTNEMVTSAITAMTNEQIKDARQRSTREEGMSNDIHDIYDILKNQFKDAAIKTKTLNETKKGLGESWAVNIANVIDPFMNIFKNFMIGLSAFKGGGWIYGIGKTAIGLIKNSNIFKGFGDSFKAAIGGRTPSFNFKTPSWFGGRPTATPRPPTPTPPSPATPRGSGKFTKGIGNSVRRLGIKTLGKNGMKALSRVTRVGTPMVGAAIAAYEVFEANAAHKKSMKEIDSSNASRYEKIQAKREARNQHGEAVGGAVGTAVGTAIGASLGSAIPVVGTLIGGAVGGVVGKYVGEGGAKLARGAKNFLFGEKDEYQLDEKSANQIDYETTKVGHEAMAQMSEDTLQVEAAKATIGIHDLLISWYNEKNGKLSNGEEKDQGLVGGIKDFFGFSEGGVVAEPKVGIDDANGDTALAKVAPNEMILTQEQQANLFNLAQMGINGANGAVAQRTSSKSDNVFLQAAAKTLGIKDISSIGNTVKSVAEVGTKTFINPIGALTSLFNSPTENLSPSRIDLNINGTLRLTGGNSSADIDMRSLLNNTQFKNQLMELINNELSKKQSGGGMVNRNSARVQRGGSQSIVHGGLS